MMAGTGRTIFRAAFLVLPAALLAGCAAAPPSDADQANLAACTQQADAAYQQDNLNGLARTGQTGLYFAPMPNHVFDSQRMGSLNARNNQIQDCVSGGSSGQSAAVGPASASAPLPAPQVTGAQNSQ
jgi:hypothetical protein